jgi:hypothetical protein
VGSMGHLVNIFMIVNGVISLMSTIFICVVELAWINWIFKVEVIMVALNELVD